MGDYMNALLIVGGTVGLMAIAGVCMAGEDVIRAWSAPACIEEVLPVDGGSCSRGGTLGLDAVDGAERFVCRCARVEQLP